MIHTKDLLTRKFDEALPYADFVALGDAEGHRPPWDERYGRLELSPEQQSLVPASPGRSTCCA